MVVAEPAVAGERPAPCQCLKLELSVIPAQAEIQIAPLDSRLRGNDEPENHEMTSR